MKKKSIAALVFISLFFSMGTNIFAKIDQHAWFIKRNGNSTPGFSDVSTIVDKYNGYYIDKNAVQNGKKVLYLTFDAGYENGNIEKILDTMKEENVTGAFFILSNMIDRSPELVCRMANEGHIVANHTSSHKDMTKVDDLEGFDKELNGLCDKYKALTGKEMARYYRPPEGRFDERGLSYAKQLGYKTVFWSFAYADWDNDNQPTEEFAKRKIFDNMHNGAVILLHPTSSTNAKILGDVIKQLKTEGYRFGTLDELTAK